MEKSIVIDDKSIPYSELTDRERYLVNQVEDINLKLATLQFQADQLTAAKQLFSVELIDSQKSKANTEPVTVIT